MYYTGHVTWKNHLYSPLMRRSHMKKCNHQSSAAASMNWTHPTWPPEGMKVKRIWWAVKCCKCQLLSKRRRCALKMLSALKTLMKLSSSFLFKLWNHCSCSIYFNSILYFRFYLVSCGILCSSCVDLWSPSLPALICIKQLQYLTLNQGLECG